MAAITTRRDTASEKPVVNTSVQKIGRPKKVSVPSKMCTKCRAVKELPEFYGHKAWAAQSYCDAWCRSCVQSHCSDVETLREYCWYNNRLWSDFHWDKALQNAVYNLANDPEYLKGPKVKKDKMEQQAACNQFYRFMNQTAYYAFSANVHEDAAFKEFNPESVAGSVRPVDDDAKPDDEDKIYSAAWNGIYAKRDIEFLDARYADYMAEHNLDTEHLRDAAKKQCKLSLMTDSVMNLYRKGEAMIDEVNKVFKMYDDSAKSNMFAACKRKPGESEGGTSFSEIAARLQSTGKIEAVKIKWPKDSVDDCIAEYYAIASKLNRDGVFS